MTQRLHRMLCLISAICLLLIGCAPAKAQGAREITQNGTRLYVDFDYLKEINPDIVGWLWQESAGFSAPIAQGADNTVYLSETALSKRDQYGAVFLDAAGSPDFTDAQSCLYSSGSTEGGSFAFVKEYADQAYYDEHPELLLLTPYADYQVELFAVIQTTVNDQDSWRIADNLNESAYQSRVSELCAASVVRCAPDARPVYGDSVLALVTCSKLSGARRVVALGRMRSIRYETTSSQDINKQAMDARESISGTVEVGPLGSMQYYAQNDPLWSQLRFEARGSSKYRDFGEGGCGPTSVAMALANLLDKDELPSLRAHASYSLGYTMCTCSVNHYFCNRLHPQYQLTTPDEFLRYLPLAVASFATGNNEWGVKSRTKAQGTNMEFLDELCLAYGITLSSTTDLSEALERLRGGGCTAIVNISQGGPFTKYGHFAVLAGSDDEYLYVLDPLSRDSYEGNKHVEIAQILRPGVVRVPLSKARECCFYRTYLFEKPQ